MFIFFLSSGSHIDLAAIGVFPAIMGIGPTAIKRIYRYNFFLDPENFEKNLIHGQVIKELVLEFFDAYGNHAQENENLELSMHGFGWVDRSTSIKVDAYGCVNLGGLSRVSADYGTNVDDKKDKATTAFLYQALTEDVILQVAGCETAKELWESLKKEHVGEEKVQHHGLQSLMIGFQTIQMTEDDTVDAFMAKLNGYATKAKQLGKTLDESLLVRKLLDSTPDRFSIQ
ncbi:hypothetical protein Tco_0389163 [Tanacetum coccineum]